MSIRLLRTIVAISETGSFGAAADVVCVSHAAVSQQMKRLEEELQVSLFDRSKRSPELSQLGQAMVRKAREIIHSYDIMVDSLLGGGPNGPRLRYGYSRCGPRLCLPDESRS